MLVMKFGGTSVGCAESILRVSQIVRARLRSRPVIVVSALARVTDQLQRAGELSRAGQLAEALDLISEIEQRHREIGQNLLPDSVRDASDRLLLPALHEARALLRAIAAIGELTARTADRLLGFGERWSSWLISQVFQAQGIPAAYVDAADLVITDANYSHAVPQFELIKSNVESRLLPLLERGQIPVLGGFIGATVEGVPTTLGRGGSDFTASIIGAGGQAERIEIWTDVDGMMSADPRICPDAQNIDAISFEEAAELAHFGAKVLHPKTLQPAVEQGIPVLVLNSRYPERRGTRVELGEENDKSRLRSVACKRGIVLAEVFVKQGLDPGLAASIFEAMKQQKCLVDLAAMSRSHLSLLLTSEDSAASLAVSLDGAAEVKVTSAVALVSLVGRNVARDPAISARALGALCEHDVKMIFHGASDMNLSFVVDEKHAETVVRSLHQALFTHNGEDSESSLLAARNPAYSDAVDALAEA